MPDAITIDEFARFLRNGTYYAWVEVPVALLNTPVPEGVEWGTVELGDESTRQKAVGEFILQTHLSIDNSTVLAPLAAMEAPTMRTHRVGRGEMENWKAMLTPYGITVDTWLDIGQFKARRSLAEYNGELR